MGWPTSSCSLLALSMPTVEKRRHKRIKRAAESQEGEEEKPVVETFDTLKEKLGAVFREQSDLANELRELEQEEGKASGFAE